MLRAALLSFAMIGAVCFAPGQDSKPAEKEKEKEKEKSGGAGVYKQAIGSVVWVHSKRSNGLATGSGSLIDAEKRLVLTNYHVVQDVANATVFFPQFRDNQPIAEKDYYRDRAKRLAISGKVIVLDKKADLAIIQIDSIPKGTVALKLATGSPDPGDNVHSIGSAGKSDALFGYVKGSVRQVYKKDWKAELEPKKIAKFEAKVIETDSPTNPGDSGGPLLNDKGELVGVTQGGALNAQLVSTFIDVSEVKQIIDTRAVRDLKADKPAEKKERKALTIADNASMFGAEATKQANEQLATFFAADLDILIETYKVADVSADKLRELKAMKSSERSAFFRDVTRDRMAKAGDAEIGLLICNEPKSFYIEIAGSAKSQFPDDFQKKLADAVTVGLKTGKPDEALQKVMTLLKDNRKAPK